jgi:hypothetical protein
MKLEYRTFGPPTAAQSAAHVAALAAIKAAGFTPFPLITHYSNGHVHAASVEILPDTYGHPAREISVPVEG